MELSALWSGSLDPARNLALEECLLGDEAPRPPLLFLYVNSPCVVIGRNQNPWVEVAPGWRGPVLRRMSGGGAVWHDEGNLNWALVVERAGHDQEGELKLMAAAISSLGVEVLPGSRGGLYAGPSSARPGAKVSGTARWLTGRKVLHHGTLLVRSDLSALGAALGGLTASSSRALASVPSPVANLGDLVPGLGLEEVAESLARALSGSPARALDEPTVEREAEAIIARRASWEWLYGETPAFSLALPALPGAGLEIRRGRVASVTGPGAEGLSGLVGRAFEPSFLEPGRVQGK